jgi:spore coat polysaccharide biosynthesis protein SpsF
MYYMTNVAIIQARMGSTRLPGKAMLSLDCIPAIQHVIRRTMNTMFIDKTVVATTTKDRDRIIAKHASIEGAEVFQGDEDDVLGRVRNAAEQYDSELVIRVTADNPLVCPKIIDTAIQKITECNAVYVSNKVDNTFPSGFDVEVFTFSSLVQVERRAEDPHYREHVTPYYRDFDEFSVANLTATEVFTEPHMQDRTDLRLTLDNPDDYELLKTVYDNINYDSTVDVGDAIEYIDAHNLGSINTT